MGCGRIAVDEGRPDTGVIRNSGDGDRLDKERSEAERTEETEAPGEIRVGMRMAGSVDAEICYSMMPAGRPFSATAGPCSTPSIRINCARVTIPVNELSSTVAW